jgi:drug/metabolite transporter (DMT)-like permease
MKVLENKWILLTILALTWGSSFILIKKSLITFTPLQIGSARVAISGIILLPFALRIFKQADTKTIGWMLLAGAMGNFIPMYLFPLAQTRVASSMAGILDSLVPVFVLILGYVFFRIRGTILQWVGIVLGFAGAVLLMRIPGADPAQTNAGYALLVVLATLCYAVSALIVSRRLRQVSAVHLSAAIYAMWMIPAVLIFLLSDQSNLSYQQPDHLWSGVGFLTILSVVGTALAMLLYYKLIQITSAVFASTVTYLIPLVSIFWGLLEGEPFNTWHAAGGLLIFAGIYMVQEKVIQK